MPREFPRRREFRLAAPAAPRSESHPADTVPRSLPGRVRSDADCWRLKRERSETKEEARRRRPPPRTRQSVIAHQRRDCVATRVEIRRARSTSVHASRSGIERAGPRATSTPLTNSTKRESAVTRAGTEDGTASVERCVAGNKIDSRFLWAESRPHRSAQPATAPGPSKSSARPTRSATSIQPSLNPQSGGGASLLGSVTACGGAPDGPTHSGKVLSPPICTVGVSFSASSGLFSPLISSW